MVLTAMKPKTLETWSWVLIYGGLLVFCVAHFVNRVDRPLALGLAAGAALSVSAGVGMIVWRSRIKD